MTLFKKRKNNAARECVATPCEISANSGRSLSYAQEFEGTLRELEAHLHESDDQREIITRTLATACNFYQGDWCGFIEADLDLNLWTPTAWYNMYDEDIAAHYSLKYTGLVNELLKTLAETNDYADIHKYAAQSLLIDPGNRKAYYWLITAMEQLGASEMAKSELLVAKQHLSDEDYAELEQQLKVLPE